MSSKPLSAAAFLQEGLPQQKYKPGGSGSGPVLNTDLAKFINEAANPLQIKKEILDEESVTGGHPTVFDDGDVMLIHDEYENRLLDVDEGISSSIVVFY